MSDDRLSVLAWGAEVRRDLPWRATRDPWAVLVSEVMLQQTQVDRVVPRWRQFLARWPDPRSCAAATLAEVLEEWQGLGYPRRARNLWETARLVCDRHGGRLPVDVEDLLALPGIGPYTARAVRAFAFEADAAVVDTNVGRILARRAGRRLTPGQAQAAADRWFAEEGTGEVWAWNQALLDLGAMLCRPAPRCEECPAALGCAWAEAGRAEPDPATGSAAVSVRQARFEGSRRQARGRLLRAAGAGPVAAERWVDVAGWAHRDGADGLVAEVVASLLDDGLAELDDAGALVLPA